MEKPSQSAGSTSLPMKTIFKQVILIMFLATMTGCGVYQPESELQRSEQYIISSGPRQLLTRGEFAPIKESILYPPFTTEVIDMAPEGSLVQRGQEIALLSPGDRLDNVILESADREKISTRLELEKIRLQTAEKIEFEKLELARLEFERCRLELARAKNSRDWLRITELEEGLKLEKIRLKLLGRQVQATQKMLSRGFSSRQEMLQFGKDLTISELNASLTIDLIPFLEKKTDEKKIKQAFENYEKSRLAYEVASLSYARNLADYRYNFNVEKRNYQEVDLRVKRFEKQVASLTVLTPEAGLLLYGSSYTGSELVKVSVGSQVYPGVKMLQIVDPNSFGVNVEVSPKEVSLVDVGSEVFFRPDAYPELLLPCKVKQASPIAMEINGGKPDGRTMVNIKAALQVKNEKVKLGYSGSVFNRSALENWQKSFRGRRIYQIRRTSLARKASTTGEVKPASFSYIVSMSSRKLNFLEEEGKTIEKGHVIAKIDSAEDQQSLKDTEIEFRKLKEELQLMVEKNQVEDVQLKRQLEVKSGALEVARLKHAALLKSRDEDKIIDLRRSLELLEAKIDLAREKVAHIKDLQKKGLRSELELMQAESEVAALLKDKAITEYKLDYEDSGPGKKAIAVSELEVAKAQAEMRRTELEVSLGRLANAMNIKVKELEIKKLELRIDEYKRLLEKSEIKAPCSGVVIHNEIRKNSGGTGKAKVGDEVFARVPFMQMAEMANLQVHTEVSEMDVKFINPGDKIRILLKGNSVSTFPGWVSSVSYVAQTQFKARQDAVVKIIIDLVSPQNGVSKIDPAFRPGQSCEVEFDLYDVKDALLVPFDAVLPLASGPCLVSPDKSLKTIEVLFSDGLNGCVVKSGVEEGDEILLMEAIDD